MAGADDEEEVLFDQAGLLNLQLKQPRSSHWCRKFIKTICLSLAFFSLGVCIAIPGPTLLDLGDQIHADTKHMAMIFTARSVGYLVGSIVGGFLFDVFDKQLLLCLTLFLCAVATAAIPWCLVLMVMAVMISIQGVAMGVLDTGGNMFCIRIWGKRSGPYMQTMHFAFGVGAFLAPLLAKPFLSTHELYSIHNKTSVTHGNIPVIINIPTDQSETEMGNLHRRKRFEDIDLLEWSLSDLSGLNRYERDVNGSTSENITNFLGISTTKIYIKPTTTKPKPKKPALADSGRLLKDNFADGAPIKDHLDKHKVVEPNVEHKGDAEPDGGEESSDDDEDEKSGQINKTITSRKEGSEVNITHTVSTSKETSSNIPAILTTTPATTTTTLETTTIKKSVTTIAQPIATTSALKSTTTTPQPVVTTAVLKSTTTTTQPVVTTAVLKSTTTTAQPVVTTAVLKSTTTTPQPVVTTAVLKSTTRPTQPVVPTSVSKVQRPVTDHEKEDKSDTSDQEKNIKNPVSGKEDILNDVNNKDQLNSSTVVSTDSGLEEDHVNPRKPITVGLIINAVKNMSKIQFVYMIIGLVLLLTSTMFLVLYCHEKRGSLMHRADDKDHELHTESLRFRIALLVMLFLFFFLYVGMEVTYGAFILTFTVQHMGWSKDQGAVMTAIFWGSLATGRGFAIFIAKCCHPPAMLIIDLTLVVIGALILSFGIGQYGVLLWVGTLFLGLGMSSVFPTGVTWAEYYIRLTGKSTAVFVVGSALGEMAVPVITGYTYQNMDKMSLMYIMLALGVGSTVIYVLMQCIASKKGRIRGKIPIDRNGFRPLEDDDDMDLEMTPYGTTLLRERHTLKLDHDEDDEEPLVKLGDDD